ncbi:CehA/McbA family metallohydrolase [Jiangella gansuensis]|uniref:CehA/McbA family metallohydrolase n=1 Tax=Jiangella gansuensis TaxID=281473 RepID=UPI0004ACD6DC|nr:CehA/McbA family metallohydrolase [Jiangella gansuensis]
MSVRSRVASAVVLIVAAAALPALPPTVAAAADDQPTYLGKRHYTGEFHAHTAISDGVQTPLDAFEHVATHSDADFFTVSEHDVLYDRRNSDDFTTDWRQAVSDEWRHLHEVTDSYNASQDDLVTIPAEEITWYDDSGHMNLFNTDWLVTARSEGDSLSFGAATGDLKYDLPTFYARLKQDPDAIAQFNHPDPSGKGSFAGFAHLDRAVDERVQLIEVKNAVNLAQFQVALDRGWHLAPVWNGDEHSATWVTGDESITGVWAAEKTQDAVYQAMRERSMYSTQDVNTVLEFGANGQLMGSVLPPDTTGVALDIALTDADAAESFTSVRVLTNGGAVAYDVPGVSGREVRVTQALPAADGDYFYVVATQADGDVVVSAPVWVGETTRGADYAPTITVESGVPSAVAFGERVALPEVTADDDSGQRPAVTYEVWDDNGQVPVEDGGFVVRGYSDHVVVVKATDAAGNIGAELLRLEVSQEDADPAGVFQYTGTVATVGAEPGTAGLSVTTDATVDRVYAQVRPAGHRTWRSTPVLTSTGDTTYEINTVGKPGEVYQDTVTGQPLRSHEFELTGLRDTTRYEYRFGVAVDGAPPRPHDDAAWTDVRGSFLAGGGQNRPIYLLGDLAADSREPADLRLLPDLLARLRDEAPGGDTVVQTGDLVPRGANREYWEDAFAHAYDGLGLQLAPVAGDAESAGDLEYNLLSPHRNAIFSSMYALPGDGPIGETNYSFDRGDVHVAVLNTVHDLDAQLEWLVGDIHAAGKPWNVVVGHRSFFGGTGADGPGMRQRREEISRVFQRLGIDLYVGGHDNVYKRSTIYDGRLARTPDEVAAGTTFVTLGPGGPNAGDNAEKPWDDVVDDEDVPMGSVLRATGRELSIATYTVDGRLVDTATIARPRGEWSVSTAELADGAVGGVGLISHPGSRDAVAVEAVRYDAAGQEVLDRRLAEVELDHRGAEQWVAFDPALPVAANDTVKLHFWDGPDRGEELRPALVLQEGLTGSGTAADPYLLDSADDFGKVAIDPAASYRLTTDLDLTGQEVAQIGDTEAFTGDLDGDGHTITGLATTHGGLVGVNAGTIHDLAIVGADISTATARGGILADTNTGTVERVYTTGLITAGSRAGGIVGDNAGVLRDAYSTARVHSYGTEAGGTVGVALAGSTTQRVYAAGPVGASTRNAGGVAGYGYTGTVLRDAVALNPAVTAPSYAHRVLGRVLAGHTATLANNWAAQSVAADVPGVPDQPAADNLMGATATAAQVQDPAFYRDTLGWDFDTVWAWDDDGLRPVLRAVTEDVTPPPSEPGTPALPRDSDGAYLASAVADLAEVTRFPDQRYRLAADLDLSGHPGLTVARTGFSGEFDGAGHRITGLTSSTGGLFPLVTEDGHLHDVAVEGAVVDTAASNVGILVNTSRGTVERVATSGTIAGGSTVGGVIGYSYGELRDSYSTASVFATGGRQAGGVVGISGAGSLTERAYATGHVEVLDNANAGGISGYAYIGTTVRHSMALNSRVVATGYAHRVVARVLAGHTATLVGNAASDAVVAAHQSVPATGPDTLNGQTRTAAQVARQSTYEAMGWDFTDVWTFDTERGRPVLRWT